MWMTYYFCVVIWTYWTSKTFALNFFNVHLKARQKYTYGTNFCTKTTGRNGTGIIMTGMGRDGNLYFIDGTERDGKSNSLTVTERDGKKNLVPCASLVYTIQ